MKLKWSLARFRHAESGSAAVEFALCSPVLLLVVTGISTFGIAINNYGTLMVATGVGARQLAISRGETLDPCATASSAVIGAAALLKSSSLSFTYSLNGVAYSGTTCSSSSTTTGSAGNLVQGGPMTLTVTYPCSLKVYGTNYAPTGCTLTAKTTEIVQ